MTLRHLSKSFRLDQEVVYLRKPKLIMESHIFK
jgi:hypothetical protein